tara:strand:+ start:361 stop:534 length:174 start_codon:yes stop_codon:yes gene_type:complete
VILSTFGGVPLLNYILCGLVFPGIFSNQTLVHAIITTSVILYAFVVFLWLSLFSRLD